jgi:hypothetical protein
MLWLTTVWMPSYPARGVISALVGGVFLLVISSPCDVSIALQAPAQEIAKWLT